MTLLVDMWSCPGNAHDALRALGVTWKRMEAQPMADQIAFYECVNVPAVLPAYIRVGR